MVNKKTVEDYLEMKSQLEASMAIISQKSKILDEAMAKNASLEHQVVDFQTDIGNKDKALKKLTEKSSTRIAELEKELSALKTKFSTSIRYSQCENNLLNLFHIYMYIYIVCWRRSPRRLLKRRANSSAAWSRSAS